MAEAVIFAGLQGSGKTSYYEQHLAATHAHVSRDLQGNTRQELVLMRECLRAGRSFVVDDTNPTREARAALIQEAKAAGFRVIAYYFDTPVRTAIGRNNHRSDKKPVPVPAILRTAKQLQAPACDEGFDEVRVIQP